MSLRTQESKWWQTPSASAHRLQGWHSRIHSSNTRGKMLKALVTLGTLGFVLFVLLLVPIFVVLFRFKAVFPLFL